jgi:hypothetical protein
VTIVERMITDTMNRRRVLQLLGGAGALALAGCASKAANSGSAATATDASEATGVIPEETAGPYPGDGSNGVDVLAENGVVRRDIRSSFGSA